MNEGNIGCEVPLCESPSVVIVQMTAPMFEVTVNIKIALCQLHYNNLLTTSEISKLLTRLNPPE